MPLILNGSTGVSAVQDGVIEFQDLNTAMFQQGTFTHTPTLLVNLDNITSALSHYMRVGNYVMISGQAIIDPTALGGVSFQLDLPIPSDFTASADAHLVLTAAGNTSATSTGDGYANVADNTLFMRIYATSTGSFTIKFSGMYKVTGA